MTPIRAQLSKVIFTMVAVSFQLFSINTANACTGIWFSITKDGPSINLNKDGLKKDNILNTFAGRTMEFGPDVADWKIIFVPAGYTYESCKLNSVDKSVLDTCVREVNPNGKIKIYEKVKGNSWKVQYNYVGFTPMKLLKNPLNPGTKLEYTLTEINDGINDQGLYCGGLYHMGFEQYSNRPAKESGTNMSNMDFIAWVLGQFGTVQQVREALSDIDVRLFDVELFGFAFEPQKMPHLHYHVVDKTGEAIVIEFVDGKPKVFSSVGAITNDPTYDWQITNLRNYVGLKAKNNEDVKFMGESYDKLSNGTGSIGLPGDFTSTSRFIRAMFLLNATLANHKEMNTPDESIARSFKILNQFDIPEGSVVETKKRNPNDVTTMEATSWTSMADLKNLRYYYHTMINRTVRMVDLSKLRQMNAVGPVLIELPQNELVIDETPKFSTVK